jgi:hypothetical protein
VLLVASNIDFDFVQVFDKVKVFVVIMMNVVELFDADVVVVVVEHIVVAAVVEAVVEIASAAGFAFVAVVEVDIFVACFVDVVVAVENIVVVAFVEKEFVVEIASAEKTSADFAFGVNYIWEVHLLDCLVPFDMENQQLGDLIVEN